MSLRSTRGRSNAVAVPARLLALVDHSVGDGAWRKSGARAGARASLVSLVGGGQARVGDPEKTKQNQMGLTLDRSANGGLIFCSRSGNWKNLRRKNKIEKSVR